MSDFYNKYPYTDFHELNLDWVIERVKKLTEDWLATQEAWNNTQEQWQQLHDYVMDYFANLDVQDEINNKINAMIADGTFLTIVTPTINQTVVDTTTSWLAAHITQPTTPAIDNTLLIAGAAADAKAAGDWLRGGVGSYDTILNNGDDLNTLTEGVYNMYPTTPTYYSNLPADIVTNKRYLLIVKGVYSFPFQIIMSQDRMAYVRSKASGTWRTWVKLIDNRQTIPTGTDLNTLSTQGEYNFYYQNDYSNAPADLPTNTQNILVTFGFSPYVTQVLYEGTHQMYFRHYNGSTWGAWLKVIDYPIQIGVSTNLNNLNNGFYNSDIITNTSTDFPNHPGTLVLNSSFSMYQNGISGRKYQILYSTSGRVYYRNETGTPGTWGSWRTMNDERMVISAGTDLNSLTNGQYNFYYQNNLTNAPAELPNNSVILINVLGTAPNYFQIIYSTRNIYMRYYGNSWGSWYTLNERRWLLPVGQDLDDLEPGVYNFYSASGNVVNQPSNLPVNSICIIECIGTAPYKFEFIYTSQGYKFMRYQNGSIWTAWQEDVKASDYMQRIDSMGAFHTFGVIGDSMSSGYALVAPGQSHDFYDYSWPQVAARKLGNTFYNFTKSGLTTRSWLTDAKGLPLMSDGSHNAQGYAIMLGVNDKNVLGTAYLGTSADIDLNDYTQNADTFYGNYSRIISLIKVQVPNAKIFVYTMPFTDSTTAAFNQAIEYMATIHANVYVVNLEPSMFAAGTFIGQNAVDGHYSPAGWIAIANYVMEQTAEVMFANKTEFYYVELIGTQWG